MKKTVGLIIMLILTLITLTGCAEINYEVQVNKDGSGEISYIYGISKKEIGFSSDLVEELVSSVKEQSEEKGYTVEVYEDEQLTGLKANKKLKDVTTEFSLQEVFEVFGEEYVKDTENKGIEIERNLFKTRYLQNAEINLSDMDKEIQVKYTLKLPAKKVTTNADEISEDGKTLKWNLKAGEIKKVEFVAEEINILPFIIIAITIIILVAIVVVFIILKKKHVTKNEN